MPGLSRAIQIPFQIGSDGGIAYTVDRVEQAANELLSIAATAPGERVMRPTYGTPLSRLLFEADDPLVQNEVKGIMTNAFRQYAPGITVTDISLESTAPDDAQAVFRISFQLPGTSTTHVAVINMGGTVHDFTFQR